MPAITPSAQDNLASFAAHLAGSRRILALCGAGLSAASGLPTFRGAGGYWRTHNAVSLASETAFEKDPSLVWQFYNYRRHMALRASPNCAHYALAKLADKRGQDFLTITQNVDGLSERAGHPSQSIERIHGGLFDIKCSGFDCDYVERNVFRDPVVPALEILDGDGDLSSAQVPMRNVPVSELPQCPQCKSALLRPGVVWFGEALPEEALTRAEQFLAAAPVDLMLVVGTSAGVWPAAGYIEQARKKGAKLAVFNTEAPDEYGVSRLLPGDWFFEGDAGKLLPQAFEGEIGKLEIDGSPPGQDQARHES